MTDKYELSIVVPAYNERKNLPILIEKYREEKKGVKFQFVIVDNGSSDDTGEYLAKEIKKKNNSFIKVVTIKKNIGYGYGINQGLKNCDADIIGWSHADMQCSPNDVFKGYNLYKKLNNPYILVKGHRYGRYWKSLILSCGLMVFASIILLKKFDDINGQPKVFNKDLIKSFKIPSLGFSYDLYVQYIAIKKGYKVRGFKVFFHERKFGISKWSTTFFSKFSTIRSFMIDCLKIRGGILR